MSVFSDRESPDTRRVPGGLAVRVSPSRGCDRRVRAVGSRERSAAL